MKKRILVLLAMRDAAAARRLSEGMGESAECRIVMDGEEAVRAAQRLQPEVMVLDCILPGLDGLAVMDRLRGEEGRMQVIGLAMMPFAEQGFLRRGVSRVLRAPWRAEALRSAVEESLRHGEETDWAQAGRRAERAAQLLAGMGMRRQLSGCLYLSYASALAAADETRMRAVGTRIYAPVAQHFGTTPQCVERLIRHAVERTMDAAHAGGMYGFFGNTIDPARGKPTNAQVIAMLAERMRVERGTGNETGNR